MLDESSLLQLGAVDCMNFLGFFISLLESTHHFAVMTFIFHSIEQLAGSSIASWR